MHQRHVASLSEDFKELITSKLTISILSIPKRWGHSDDALLSNTHSQKTLIHTGDQPADPDVSVIGPHAGVAAAESGENRL